jgi:hypothetical protein
VETVGTTETTYDFVGGGSAVSKTVFHAIAFVHRDRLYICSLQVEAAQHDTFKLALYELCESVRATTD